MLSLFLLSELSCVDGANVDENKGVVLVLILVVVANLTAKPN